MKRDIIIVSLVIGAAITAGVLFLVEKNKPDLKLGTAANNLPAATSSAKIVPAQDKPDTNQEKDVVAPALQTDAATTTNSKTPVRPTDPGKTTVLSNATATEKNLPDDYERFIVAIGEGDKAKVTASLLDQGFIASRDSFENAIDPATVAFGPGGYKLSKTMSVPQIIKTLQSKPYMVWVIIPEGLRKEETGSLLAEELGWTALQEEEWTKKDTTANASYFEGVYFPDTYLIPEGESPDNAAKRLVAKFNEEFAVYLPEFTERNIKWTTGLTFASIVQREAANAADMPLIAGILWNRIDQGMALNADATLQYARGNTENGWWATISVANKQIDSPYNTYTNKGLPPHPICSPGISAIEATLNPVQTDCLFYLHDSNHTTHCAKTYNEHLQNIEKYLK